MRQESEVVVSTKLFLISGLLVAVMALSCSAFTFGERVRVYPHKSVGKAIFSPDGQRVLLCSEDIVSTHDNWHAFAYFITLRDVRSGARIQTFRTDGSVRAIAVSPDGRQVAAALWNSIILWDVASGRKVSTLKSDESRHINDLLFLPGGKRIISGGTGSREYNGLLLWDTAGTNVAVHSFYDTPPRGFGDVKEIECIALSHDASKVAAACNFDDRAWIIKLFDTQSQKLIAQNWFNDQHGFGRGGQVNYIDAVEFSNDDKLIMTNVQYAPEEDSFRRDPVTSKVCFYEGQTVGFVKELECAYRAAVFIPGDNLLVGLSKYLYGGEVRKVGNSAILREARFSWAYPIGGACMRASPNEPFVLAIDDKGVAGLIYVGEEDQRRLPPEETIETEYFVKVRSDTQITVFLLFKNATPKTLTGVSYEAIVKDSFGEILHRIEGKTLETLGPGQAKTISHDYTKEDSPETYAKLYAPANAEAIEVHINVLKTIFAPQ